MESRPCGMPIFFGCLYTVLYPQLLQIPLNPASHDVMASNSLHGLFCKSAMDRSPCCTSMSATRRAHLNELRATKKKRGKAVES